MKCKKLKLTEKFLNKETTDKETNILLKHLETCNICKKYVLINEKLDNIKNFTKHTAPAYLTNTIISNITKEKHKISIPIFLKTPIYQLQYVFIAILILTILWLPITKKIYQQKIIVRFEIDIPTATSVSIAGDFNKWNPHLTKCKKQKDKWIAEVALKPGRYQYMFVVDKELWIPDPNAEEYIYDSFGKKNSILDTYVCAVRG